MSNFTKKQTQKHKIISMIVLIILITAIPVFLLAITADRKAPEITTSLNPGRIKVGTVISFNITDESPLSEIYYCWDRNTSKGEVQTKQLTGTNTKYVFDIAIPFADNLGLHEFSIKAKDSEQNEGEWIDIPLYVVSQDVPDDYTDITKPVFKRNVPDDYPYSGDEINFGQTIKVQIEDDNGIYWLGYKWVRNKETSYSEGATYIYNPGNEYTFTAPAKVPGDAGEWYLQYYCMDSFGNISKGAWSQFIVKDLEAPVLTLNGFDIDIPLNGKFEDPGADWTDNVDGKGTVKANEPLYTNIAGKQTLSYTYTDSSGNKSNTVYRVVNVVKTEYDISSIVNFNQAGYEMPYSTEGNTIQINGKTTQELANLGIKVDYIYEHRTDTSITDKTKATKTGDYTVTAIFTIDETTTAGQELAKNYSGIKVNNNTTDRNKLTTTLKITPIEYDISDIVSFNQEGYSKEYKAEGTTIAVNETQSLANLGIKVDYIYEHRADTSITDKTKATKAGTYNVTATFTIDETTMAGQALAINYSGVKVNSNTSNKNKLTTTLEITQAEYDISDIVSFNQAGYRKEYKAEGTTIAVNETQSLANLGIKVDYIYEHRADTSITDKTKATKAGTYNVTATFTIDETTMAGQALAINYSGVKVNSNTSNKNKLTTTLEITQAEYDISDIVSFNQEGYSKEYKAEGTTIAVNETQSLANLGIKVDYIYEHRVDISITETSKATKVGVYNVTATFTIDETTTAGQTLAINYSGVKVNNNTSNKNKLTTTLEITQAEYDISDIVSFNQEGYSKEYKAEGTTIEINETQSLANLGIKVDYIYEHMSDTSITEKSKATQAGTYNVTATFTIDTQTQAGQVLAINYSGVKVNSNTSNRNKLTTTLEITKIEYDISDIVSFNQAGYSEEYNKEGITIAVNETQSLANLGIKVDYIYEHTTDTSITETSKATKVGIYNVTATFTIDETTMAGQALAINYSGVKVNSNTSNRNKLTTILEITEPDPIKLTAQNVKVEFAQGEESPKVYYDKEEKTATVKVFVMEGEGENAKPKYLTEGKDYEITEPIVYKKYQGTEFVQLQDGKKPIDAGIYRAYVSIKGIGAYTGTVTNANGRIDILARAITKENVKVEFVQGEESPKVNYDKEEKTATVKVYITEGEGENAKQIDLTDQCDITPIVYKKYENNQFIQLQEGEKPTNAGIYRAYVTVTGKENGNCKGTVKDANARIDIVARSITRENVKVEFIQGEELSKVNYDKEEKTATVKVFVMEGEGENAKQIDLTDQCNITPVVYKKYENNQFIQLQEGEKPTNAGIYRAYVTVTGKENGNCKGTVKDANARIDIVARSITRENVKVEFIQGVTSPKIEYDGKEKTATTKVYFTEGEGENAKQIDLTDQCNITPVVYKKYDYENKIYTELEEGKAPKYPGTYRAYVTVTGKENGNCKGIVKNANERLDITGKAPYDISDIVNFDVNGYNKEYKEEGNTIEVEGKTAEELKELGIKVEYEYICEDTSITDKTKATEIGIYNVTATFTIDEETTAGKQLAKKYLGIQVGEDEQGNATNKLTTILQITQAQYDISSKVSFNKEGYSKEYKEEGNTIAVNGQEGLAQLGIKVDYIYEHSADTSITDKTKASKVGIYDVTATFTIDETTPAGQALAVHYSGVKANNNTINTNKLTTMLQITPIEYDISDKVSFNQTGYSKEYSEEGNTIVVNETQSLADLGIKVTYVYKHTTDANVTQTSKATKVGIYNVTAIFTIDETTAAGQALAVNYSGVKANNNTTNTNVLTTTLEITQAEYNLIDKVNFNQIGYSKEYAQEGNTIVVNGKTTQELANLGIKVTYLYEHRADTSITETSKATKVGIYNVTAIFTIDETTVAGQALAVNYLGVKANNNTTNRNKLTTTLEIEKATPEYQEIADLTALKGTTLASIRLPEGFSFQDDLSTSVGDIGNNTFKVTYTPTDTTNYKTITDIEVTVLVKEEDFVNGIKVTTNAKKSYSYGESLETLEIKVITLMASGKDGTDVTEIATINKPQKAIANPLGKLEIPVSYDKWSEIVTIEVVEPAILYIEESDEEDGTEGKLPDTLTITDVKLRIFATEGFTTAVKKNGRIVKTYSTGYYLLSGEGTYTVTLSTTAGTELTTKTIIVKTNRPQVEVVENNNGSYTVTIKDFSTIKSVEVNYNGSKSEKISEFVLNSDGSASCTFTQSGMYGITVINNLNLINADEGFMIF